MSMNLMAKAMQAKVGNPLKKLVLLKLADNANDAGECWPSYQHIADECEMSRRSAVNQIAQLESDGFLWVEKRRVGESQSLTNVYHLTIDVSKNSSESQSLGGAGAALGGAGDALGGGAGAAPRTSHSFEPVNEPIKKTKAKKVSANSNSNSPAEKPKAKANPQTDLARQSPSVKKSSKPTKPSEPFPISQELVDEIIAYRNLLKKPVTDRALRGIANDMLDAQSKTGLSLEQLAELMQVKGWMTIKADWVNRVLEQARQKNQGHQGQAVHGQGKSLTDIIWGWEE